MKLFCGWGILDADYAVTKTGIIDNRKVVVWGCPYYRDWRAMIIRCHYQKASITKHSYTRSTLTDTWKYFSNFKKWVDSQPNKDWENCQPDKDLLIDGNKHYSPETCVYVAGNINRFITDHGSARGKYMLGVSKCRTSKINPFQAECSNPFEGSTSYIGIFPTELDAHLAWQTKKHEYACQLAELQDDNRVADALRQRYAPDKDWTKR